MDTLFRKLRGALVTGVLWSGAWAVASFGLSAALHLLGVGTGVPFWSAMPSIFLANAFVGFASGAGFSLFLGVVYRNHEFSEISLTSFTLLGVGVAAFLVTGLSFAPFLLAGVSVPSVVIFSTAVTSGLLGGSTAFAMLKVARAAPDSIETGDAAVLGQGDRPSGTGAESAQNQV